MPIPILAAIPAALKALGGIMGALGAGGAAGAGGATSGMGGLMQLASMSGPDATSGSTGATVGRTTGTQLSDLSQATAQPAQRVNRAEMIPKPGSNTAQPGSAMPQPATGGPQKLTPPKMPNAPNPYMWGSDVSGFANAGMVPPALPPNNPPPLPEPSLGLPNPQQMVGQGAMPNSQRLANMSQALPGPRSGIQQRYGQAASQNTGSQLRSLMALAATNAIRKNQNAQADKSRKPMGRLTTYLDKLSRS